MRTHLQRSGSQSPSPENDEITWRGSVADGLPAAAMHQSGASALFEAVSVRVYG